MTISLWVSLGTMQNQGFKFKQGVHLTFKTGGRIRKTANHINPQAVYVHMYTLKKSRQNDCYARAPPATPPS